MRKDKRCLDYHKAIKESEEKLWNLERHQNKAIVRDRIRFLRLLKSGACSSQAEAGKQIGLKRRASEKLWSKYHREGIAGMLVYPYQGTKGKLTEDQLQLLDEELCRDTTQSRQQACDFVEKQFGVHYTSAGIGYVFQRLKVKKKTGRPRYAGKDHEGEQVFKKKTYPELKRQYGRRTYLHDEMRAGTRTQCGRRWTPRGHRPVCKVKLGYEFTYLYAAIAPATGRLIALLLPDMTKECFRIFVDHFQKETKTLHGTHKVVLIADKAGSHQKAVCEQRGIAFEPLPTGCPELNPAERFFEELRKELRDHIFDSMEDLEEYLCQILKKYFDHPETLVQLCHYPYIRDA